MMRYLRLWILYTPFPVEVQASCGIGGNFPLFHVN
jgi:hypothetical protein